jgi:hypothetical protein
LASDGKSVPLFLFCCLLSSVALPVEMGINSLFCYFVIVSNDR